MKAIKVGAFEAEVLSVLLSDPREAYGVRIHDLIKQSTGRSVSFGALYTALERLERKGLVYSWWGEPTQERGGRRKRYFRLQAAAARVLTKNNEPRGEALFGGLVPQGG